MLDFFPFIHQFSDHELVPQLPPKVNADVLCCFNFVVSM